MVGETGPVRLLESQIRDAGELLARAFHDDPLCSYITPGDAKRARDLPWIMTAFIRYCYPFGTVYTTSGALEGVAVWAPPGHASITLVRMLRAGLLVAPIKVGLTDTRRFLNITNHLEELHKKEVPPRHWYLMWLGVAPSSRGRGIGSALVQAVTSRADEEGLLCYLENTKAMNLAFYQRHGFDVVSETDVPKGGPHIWTMKREPRERARGGGGRLW